MASGGTGDVLAGTIGALLAQGLAPYDAARLGVYLHGQAGELVRERIGDAGPARERPARGRADGPQAAGRDRRAAADRTPAGVRGAGRGAAADEDRRGTRTAAGRRGRRDATGPVPTEPGAEPPRRPARPPGLPDRSRSRRGSHGPACRRSRGWPGSRSTSTRCGGTSRCSARSSGPDTRVEPVVKADAYGHGAVPVALALEAAGADGLSVATLDEAFELREAGVTLPLLVIYPIPPDRGRGCRRGRHRRQPGAGRWPASASCAPAAGLPSTARGPPRGRDRPRPGRRPARGRRRSDRGGEGIARRAAGRRLDAPGGRRRCGQRPGPGRAVRRGPGPRGRRRLGWGTRRRPTPPRRQRRRPRRGGGALGLRAHGPRRLRPGAGRPGPAAGHGRRRVAPAPGHGPQGPSGASAGASRRARRELRSDLRDDPADADRDAARRATATAGAAPSPTGPRRWSGVFASRWWAAWRWTPSWPT